jgi:hypothetical protein
MLSDPEADWYGFDLRKAQRLHAIPRDALRKSGYFDNALRFGTVVDAIGESSATQAAGGRYDPWRRRDGQALARSRGLEDPSHMYRQRGALGSLHLDRRFTTLVVREDVGVDVSHRRERKGCAQRLRCQLSFRPQLRPSPGDFSHGWGDIA